MLLSQGKPLSTQLTFLNKISALSAVCKKVVKVSADSILLLLQDAKACWGGLIYAYECYYKLECGHLVSG